MIAEQFHLRRIHLIRPALVILSLLLFIPLPRPAEGHGGGAPKLVNEPAGPYLLSVWLAPDPLRVGTVHATVAVSEPNEDGSAGEPVLGAAVRILLTAEDQLGVAPIGALATHQNAANRLFYEADLQVSEPGNWQVEVIVDGPAGSGQSAFSTLVLPPASTNWFVLGAAALAIAAAVALILLSGQRRKGGERTRHDRGRSRTERRSGKDAVAGQ
jgi:hypothetical protein